MEILARQIVGLKWLILAIVSVLTAFFAYQIKFIEVDSNVVNALPADDEHVRLFREVGDQFGSNQIGLIIVEDDNVFDAQTLNNIQMITDSVAEIDGVVSVTSITNMMTFQVDDDFITCLLYTSPSPRDATLSRMPSSA